MSRQVWCSECAKDKHPGTRKVFDESEWGEPAEYERVVKGRARKPHAAQRYLLVNAVRHPLSLDAFDCDNCGSRIAPGAEAATWTVWSEDMEEPPEWESEYLERT